MKPNPVHFCQITLSGQDATKFLQGQLTINVNKLTTVQMPCAISNIKGRILFGLWAYRQGDDFVLISTADMVDHLIAHIKKYGAFSKFNTSTPAPIYPCVVSGETMFCDEQSCADFDTWAKVSIAAANYWIDSDTSQLFLPQELRLHQRGGVDYDKGCYLGQEIIARMWFKSSPKSYLHRVKLSQYAQAGKKIGKVQIVNIIPCQHQSDGDTHETYEALVIGSVDDVASIGEILPLPDGLNGSVARVV